MKALFKQLGDRPDDGDAERLRHRFLVYMALLMSGGGVLWGTLALVFSVGAAAIIPLSYTGATIINLVYFRARKNFYRVRAIQVSLSLLLPFLFQWSLGGFVVSGAVMLWAMLALVGSLTFTGVRSSLKWLAMYVVLVIASGVVDGYVREHYRMDVGPSTQTMFFVVNIVVISSVVFGLTLYMLAQRDRAQKKQAELEEDLTKARKMGSYRLMKKLGQGGMGEVWLAEHTLLARPAAVKLIKPRMLDADPARVEVLLLRFEREAQATASLRSPHTVNLFDFGRTEGGAFYYVMEFLDGCTLETLVEREGSINPGRAAYILAQVCDSLAEAHAAGLVHRDIKPANIFLSCYGRRCDHVHVLDFGLVKVSDARESDAINLTGGNSLACTPAYASPETHMSPDRIDPRADIYSLGCVAYWLLTGQLTFDAETPIKIAMLHIGETPARPSQRVATPIPAELEALVMECLAKDPERRPQDVGALGDAFAAIARAAGWGPAEARAWWASHDGFGDPDVPLRREHEHRARFMADSDAILNRESSAHDTLASL